MLLNMMNALRYHAKCINMSTDQYNTLNSCLQMNIQDLKWLCCSCDAPSNAKSISKQVSEELKKTLPILVKKH